MTTKLALFTSAIAAVSLCAPAAFAADATASNAGAAQATEITSIVVTARKREENLQRVPIAVTANTGV
jgi:outer membrane receptor protein involved in Fe transport